MLSPRGVEGTEPTTLEQARARPDLVAARRSLGYQVALAGCVALLAVVALSLLADRAAARGRAADLLLRRVGLRRSGPVRARVLELVLTAALALVLAVGRRPAADAGRRDGRRRRRRGASRAGASGRPSPRSRRPPPRRVVAAGLAGLVSAVRGRTGSDGRVLRDAD